MYLEEQPIPKMKLFLVSTLQIIRFMKLSFLSIIIETEKLISIKFLPLLSS